jgi:hypothetical protein
MFYLETSHTHAKNAYLMGFDSCHVPVCLRRKLGCHASPIIDAVSLTCGIRILLNYLSKFKRIRTGDYRS